MAPFIFIALVIGVYAAILVDCLHCRRPTHPADLTREQRLFHLVLKGP